MTHYSLWADFGMIMMDGIVFLSYGSTELDFVTSIVIKQGQIVATAIEVDSVKMLPDIEPDDDKSIPSAESILSCVKRNDEFRYPCIVSDEAMDAEEKEFHLDMDIIESLYARAQVIPREKGTMLKCVHDLYIRAGKNLFVKESGKVKELLVEHNKTTFHDPEKPLTRTNTIKHKIPTNGRPVRIPPHRVAWGRR